MAQHRWRTVARTGSTTQRGYGAAHQALRKSWKPRVDAGLVACWRCRRLIEPGSRWHLGHNDARTGYMGPEHASCNLKAAARVGYQRQQAKLTKPAPKYRSRVVNLAALRRSR